MFASGNIMGDTQLTLGQAIDRIVEALQSIDATARPTVLATVCAHLQIPMAAAVTMKPTMPPSVPASVETLPTAPAFQAANNAVLDIRTLKLEKQPKTAGQMACLVAYYLQDAAPESERKATISAADLEKFFKQAGFKLPKALDQLLVDAKHSGYFEAAGKGSYRLTPVGYNLVVHNLPANKPV
jgi:hypothetical protein